MGLIGIADSPMLLVFVGSEWTEQDIPLPDLESRGALVTKQFSFLEVKLNNKTTGIIATVVLCGCPGLFLCLFGAILAIGRGTFSGPFSNGKIHPVIGLSLMCLAIRMIAKHIVVGFFSLRDKPVARNNEPIPPAS